MYFIDYIKVSSTTLVSCTTSSEFMLFIFIGVCLVEMIMYYLFNADANELPHIIKNLLHSIVNTFEYVSRKKLLFRVALMCNASISYVVLH